MMRPFLPLRQCHSGTNTAYNPCYVYAALSPPAGPQRRYHRHDNEPPPFESLEELHLRGSLIHDWPLRVAACELSAEVGG